MAEASKSKSKNGNRYSGVDSQPWIVRTAAGDEVGKAALSFREANAAAETYTETTGEYAAAVRA